MLGACFTSAEKVSKSILVSVPPEDKLALCKTKNTSIIVATEQPSVAVFAVVNLALAITNQRRPGFAPCRLPALRIRFSHWLVSEAFRAKTHMGEPL
jgi:hypothetical protein